MQGNTCRAIVIMKPTNGQVNKQPRQKRELCDSVQAQCSHFICMISSNTCSALMSPVQNTHDTIYLFDQNARHLHTCLNLKPTPLWNNSNNETFVMLFPSSKAVSSFNKDSRAEKCDVTCTIFLTFLSIARNFTQSFILSNSCHLL